MLGELSCLPSQPICLKSVPMSRLKRIITNLKSAAKRRAAVFDPELSLEAVLEHGLFADRCPYSGIRLDYGQRAYGGAFFDSPSFDRIDPDGEYTIANLR